VNARHETSEARLRILVGDDHEDSALSLALVLESMGCGVRTATDGRAALEAALEFRPDAVLLDIGMPSLDGYEVCRRIRAETGWGNEVVLLALTGRGHDEDKRRSLEAGFDGHLVKPIDPDAILRLVRSVRSAR